MLQSIRLKFQNYQQKTFLSFLNRITRSTEFSAIELFELFWDDSLLQSMIEQIELYSAW